MLRALNEKIRLAPHGVAEADEKLQQQGGLIGFSMWNESKDNLAGEPALRYICWLWPFRVVMLRQARVVDLLVVIAIIDAGKFHGVFPFIRSLKSVLAWCGTAKQALRPAHRHCSVQMRALSKPVLLASRSTRTVRPAKPGTSGSFPIAPAEPIAHK